MEAQRVHELFEKGTPVYIFDSEEYKAAEVQVNLEDRVKSMGSVNEWWAFCQSHQPGAGSAPTHAAAAPPSPTNVALRKRALH